MWLRRVWMSHVDRVPIAMVGMGDGMARGAFAFGPCRDGEAADSCCSDGAEIVRGERTGCKLSGWACPYATGCWKKWREGA